MESHEIIQRVLNALPQPLWNRWNIGQQMDSSEGTAYFSLTDANSPERASLKLKVIATITTMFFDNKSREIYFERKKNTVINDLSRIGVLETCPYVVSYDEADIRSISVDGKTEGCCLAVRTEPLTNLMTAIKNGSFDFSEANLISLAMNIAQALNAAHNAEILHNDMRPENIFFNSNNIYKLDNFNSDKQFTSNERSDIFIAPEVHRMKANETVKPISDIYSFGLCLYMLTNNMKLPFEDSYSPSDAFALRMNGETPLPAPKKASPAFAAAILKACQFNPQNRYASMSEMIAQLQAIMPPVSKTLVPPVQEVPAQPVNPQPVPQNQPPQYFPPPVQPNMNQGNPPVYTNGNEAVKQNNLPIIIFIIAAIIVLFIGVAVGISFSSDNSRGYINSNRSEKSSKSDSSYDDEEKILTEAPVITTVTTESTTITTTTTTVTTTVTTTTAEKLYSVRLSWEDKDSEVQTYRLFENAKKFVDTHPRYKVYDMLGNEVYSVTETTQAPTVPPTDYPTPPLKPDMQFNAVGEVITETDDLNVRSGPGTEYEKIGTVPKNGYVTITGISGQWYAIMFEGGTGYVSGEFIFVY